MKKILSIIIPVFNEEKTIIELLKRVKNANLPVGINKEIIVIDDCSDDETPGFLKRLKNIRFTYIKHPKNLGKGAAIRTGISKSSGNYVIIQDADLEYNPIFYSKLLEPILKGNAKVVYGTRLRNYPLNLWGENKTVLPIHLFANKFLTFVTNLLYGANLTDMETGYKLFKSNILKKITIKSNKFDFEPEITAKILKRKIYIVEVPIDVKPRSYEEGKKIGFRDGLIAVLTLLKYRFVD